MPPKQQAMKRHAAPGVRRKKTAPAPVAKRSRGRPPTSQASGTRNAIITAAAQLLDRLPPHRVTTVLIASKAGVDPKLLRYYFHSREDLLIAVIENILVEWAATHPPANAPPADRLSAHIAAMLDFSLRVRSMQRLMIDECAEAKSPAVRERVRELNAMAVRSYAEYLHLDAAAAETQPDPLFLHVAVIGVCEFFAAAQAMIMPLAPKGLSAATLTKRYEKFIRGLLLDGIRSQVETSAKIKGGA
jgi:TetR/AcrR family transcriptional regulator